MQRDAQGAASPVSSPTPNVPSGQTGDPLLQVSRQEVSRLHQCPRPALPCPAPVVPHPGSLMMISALSSMFVHFPRHGILKVFRLSKDFSHRRGLDARQNPRQPSYARIPGPDEACDVFCVSRFIRIPRIGFSPFCSGRHVRKRAESGK